MSDQMQLGAAVEIPEHRVQALAGVIAGFVGEPGTSFEKLRKPQQEAALDAARLALERVAETAQ